MILNDDGSNVLIKNLPHFESDETVCRIEIYSTQRQLFHKDSISLGL